jgi:hypothetical protein
MHDTLHRTALLPLWLVIWSRCFHKNSKKKHINLQFIAFARHHKLNSQIIRTLKSYQIPSSTNGKFMNKIISLSWPKIALFVKTYRHHQLHTYHNVILLLLLSSAASVGAAAAQHDQLFTWPLYKPNTQVVHSNDDTASQLNFILNPKTERHAALRLVVNRKSFRTEVFSTASGPFHYKEHIV